MGIGLLEADLRLEPVGFDQQQDKVGPAGGQLVGDRGVLRRQGAGDDAVAVHRLGGVGPAAGGALPVPPAGDVEDDTHGWRPDTVSPIISWRVQDVLPMGDPITVVSYDPAWPEIFGQLGTQLRAALGGVALRIDHIGSTAVPGLAAKPIVDVQILVERLEPVDPFRRPWRPPGFRYRAANTERTKRYFREPPGQRRTHLRVRRAGSFSERMREAPRRGRSAR
jgi:hypothetical protein